MAIGVRVHAEFLTASPRAAGCASGWRLDRCADGVCLWLATRRVSEWLAATLEMWCPERGCGFDSRALRCAKCLIGNGFRRFVGGPPLALESAPCAVPLPFRSSTVARVCRKDRRAAAERVPAAVGPRRGGPARLRLRATPAAKHRGLGDAPQALVEVHGRRRSRWFSAATPTASRTWSSRPTRRSSSTCRIPTA